MGGLDHKGVWTSTSDTGWALLALAEYFRGHKFPTSPLELTVQQPDGRRQQFILDPKGFRTFLGPSGLLKNAGNSRRPSAKGTMLYKVEVTAPRTDIAAAGENHGLKVWKTIQNTDGTAEIKVGDLVKVRVFAELQGKDQRYLVLDDPLPAGLVAVNTAFATRPNPGKGRKIRKKIPSNMSLRKAVTVSVPISSKSAAIGTGVQGLRLFRHLCL